MSLRAKLGRWLFDQDPREKWPGASPSDADWDEYVGRNREEWRQIADEILHESPVHKLTDLVYWLVSLDSPNPENAKVRQTVTLTEIIERAREALEIPHE